MRKRAHARPRTTVWRSAWRQAVTYAQQIVDAFAAAHARGSFIVTSPANIIVTEQRAIKVLDFGLAKRSTLLREVNTSSAEAANKDGTYASGIAGTVAYMSPEQAAGKAIDARTDIFSLGCVLYEMLTGRRAFERGSQLETLQPFCTKNRRSAPSRPLCRGSSNRSLNAAWRRSRAEVR
ncbi:MAG: protein kinase [Bryobacteraceae bacterium]